MQDGNELVSASDIGVFNCCGNHVHFL